MDLLNWQLVVGRAVDFDTRGPRFDSSHRQNFIEHLFIINCIEKTKINKKRPGMAHLLKKMSFIFLLHLGTSVIFQYLITRTNGLKSTSLFHTYITPLVSSRQCHLSFCFFLAFPETISKYQYTGKIDQIVAFDIKLFQL